VSDDGRHSYEEMPGAVLVDPPRERVVGMSASPTPEPVADAPYLRVNQMARLVARITLLTTVDPQRRVRHVLPACSLIVLGAVLARN